MTQVPPCKGVIMSTVTLFRRTTFVIRDSSVFIKDRLCWLSLKACWVHLVRISMYAVMPSRMMEGTKMVAKCPYQWEAESVHLALRKGRLVALGA